VRFQGFCLAVRKSGGLNANTTKPRHGKSVVWKVDKRGEKIGSRGSQCFEKEQTECRNSFFLGEKDWGLEKILKLLANCGIEKNGKGLNSTHPKYRDAVVRETQRRAKVDGRGVKEKCGWGGCALLG